MNIGVVGATGMVGEVFMEILGLRQFPLTKLRPFASEKSEGLKVIAAGREWPVEKLRPGCFDGLDIVFFSSGDDVSKEWAPEAVRAGAMAIDNSAAFRMDDQYPLVVPEVNGHLIPSLSSPTIIANPNCSTIQLVVALQALKKYGLNEVRVATYQSVSGAGKAGRDELLQQTRKYFESSNSDEKSGLTGGNSEQMRVKSEPGAGKSEPARRQKSTPRVFPHEIAFNCLPHIGSFNENGYCSEEMKIINETKKIMALPHLIVSAFTVRVPSLNSHSEAVWVTLDKAVSREEITSSLYSGSGLQYVEQREPSEYPTAQWASGQNPVFVGRLHQDLHDPHTWLMWIVADNILKGAALNGIQIAERLIQR